LFFPTGTMANLTSVMAWCNGRGEEVIGTWLPPLFCPLIIVSVGDCSHIFVNEGGGAAHIGGVSLRTVPNQSDGTLSIDHIKAAIRSPDIHNPITRLVSIENTQNFQGGRVIPSSYFDELSPVLKAHNIALHIDGARIWNAAIATGQPLSEICRHADSISVCMSKGLGAPVGSLLIGPSSFIQLARRIRKTLGGGMRQVGVLGIACSVALDDYESGVIIHDDHRRAKRIGEELSNDPLYVIHRDHIESNMVVIILQDCYLQKGVNAMIVSAKLKSKQILSNARNESSLRVVIHRDLNDEVITKIIRAYQEVSEEIRREFSGE
jgi:threonine aldolase